MNFLTFKETSKNVQQVFKCGTRYTCLKSLRGVNENTKNSCILPMLRNERKIITESHWYHRHDLLQR